MGTRKTTSQLKDTASTGGGVSESSGKRAAGRRGFAGGGTREPVANGRGQAAAPALRNIEIPVMTIQGMNTMKPKKDTQWGITRMRAVA